MRQCMCSACLYDALLVQALPPVISTSQILLPCMHFAFNPKDLAVQVYSGVLHTAAASIVRELLLVCTGLTQLQLMAC